MRDAPESRKQGGSLQKVTVRLRDRFSDPAPSLRRGRYVMRAKGRTRLADQSPIRAKAIAFRARARASESGLAGHLRPDGSRCRGRASAACKRVIRIVRPSRAEAQARRRSRTEN